MDRRQPAESTASTLSTEALEREPSGTTGEGAVRAESLSRQAGQTGWRGCRRSQSVLLIVTATGRPAGVLWNRTPCRSAASRPPTPHRSSGSRGAGGLRPARSDIRCRVPRQSFRHSFRKCTASDGWQARPDEGARRQVGSRRVHTARLSVSRRTAAMSRPNCRAAHARRRPHPAIKPQPKSPEGRDRQQRRHRHVHPSTLYPGGIATIPSVQLFTEYMTRIGYCTVRILVLEAGKIDRA
jgi:hypothetical protein